MKQLLRFSAGSVSVVPGFASRTAPAPIAGGGQMDRSSTPCAMTRKQDRFAHLAETKVEVDGLVVRIRASATREGVDAAYVRESVAAFQSDWMVETDGRTRNLQLAVFKHKGLIL